jgi:hypothetical protein
MDDDGIRLAIVVMNAPPVLIDTGLRGTIDDDGRLIIPFANQENAVDCLRIVTQSIRQRFEESI